MAFDKVILTTQEHGRIVRREIMMESRDYGGIVTHRSQSDFGSIVFNELPCEGYTIWQSYYRFNQDAELAYTIAPAMLVLPLVLKKNFRYTINGHEDIIRMHQYNLFYLPSMQRNFMFQKGIEYSALNICYDPSLLAELEETLPDLSPFIRRIGQNTTATLNDQHLPASSAMMDLAVDILYNDAPGAMKQPFLRGKAGELLIHALEQTIDMKARIATMRDTDVKKILQARAYLAENPQITLRELARHVRMNRTRLENGFRHLYGDTVFGVVNEENMQHGRLLVLEGKLPIKAVAAEVNYGSASSFSTAFTKRFKKPPSALRGRQWTEKTLVE